MAISPVSKRTEYPFDLGTFGRPITTTNPSAQTWFNRGLTWVYTFNHKEAVTCFEQAIAHDELCAIAYWGLAYALGPNYNFTWEFFGEDLNDIVRRTYEASKKAQDLAQSATPIEQALIMAIQARFASDKPAEDMEQYASQNRAYADAMEKVYHAFGDDLDVAALYADSLMSLTPWKLWNLKTGLPIPGARTLDAKNVLERALCDKNAANHPGILHFYIHLIEMSPTPELGLIPADHLRELVPDSGHANHMPSHLDVLVGDYRAAIRANQRATIADEKYLHYEGAMNFYSNYRLHNYHTLIYAAMFAGQKAVALDAVERMEKTLPKELLVSLADFVEVYLSVRPHVMVRFGMWKEIIRDLPVPVDQELYCVTTAMVYYAKGVAHAATGNIQEAKRYRTLYTAAAQSVPESRLDFPNKCTDILVIASAMLDGEIEYRAGKYEAAFSHLARAMQLDDSLGYSEPWSWMQPARHAYAALLLEQNHVEEALAVYKTDLGFDNSVIRARRHANNVWALRGYHECLLRLGRRDEAAVIEPQLTLAVAVADVDVSKSCFCARASGMETGEHGLRAPGKDGDGNEACCR
ncbi:tetratricopeptide repeat protein [Aspergillus foveolatus]|uniref:tetratricopeptide repeat protein n=1 Tax=Aspergillus foveolatus TaxID=210207 RepID=UPI003CCCC2D5